MRGDNVDEWKVGLLVCGFVAGVVVRVKKSSLRVDKGFLTKHNSQ